MNTGNTSAERQSWTLELKPDKGVFDLRLKELWQARDLIGLFVRRDLSVVYKQTVLGPLWFIIEPIVKTVVFTVVFGNLVGVSTDGAEPFLFFMAGNVIWSYFSVTLNKTANVFTDNASIFGKVYFPRLVVPISDVISNLIKFLMQFAIFVAFYLYFAAGDETLRPNANLIFLPLLFLQLLLLTVGGGILISSMTTKYRDLRILFQFSISILMYATPVVYPLSTVPEQYRLALSVLNPMVAIVESFRGMFLGESAVDTTMIAASVIVTLVVTVLGVLVFTRVEKTFMDTV